MATRLNQKGIARELGVSQQRVNQLIKAGKLIKGLDGMIDLDEARAHRESALAVHGPKMLFVENSNGKKAAPMKIVALASGTKAQEYDEFGLPVDLAPAAVEPVVSASNTASDMLAANQRMQALRERKLENEILRAEMRTKRESGLLIARDEVRKQGVAAGKVISTVLSALPAEIANSFADPAKKLEVQRSVQLKVEQMQAALFAAINSVVTDDV